MTYKQLYPIIIPYIIFRATVAKLDLDEPSELEKTLMEPVRIVRTSLVSAVHQVQSVSSQVGSAVNDATDQFSCKPLPLLFHSLTILS